MNIFKRLYEAVKYGGKWRMSEQQIANRIERGETRFPGKFSIFTGDNYNPIDGAKEYRAMMESIKNGEGTVIDWRNPDCKW